MPLASRLLVMRSPQYEIVEADEHGGIHTGRLVPVYEKLGPLTVKPLRRVLAQLVGPGPGRRSPTRCRRSCASGSA